MAGLELLNGKDPVDAAIASADGKDVTRVEMTQVQVQLATGRPAVVAVPVDISDFELLNLVGAVLQVGDQLRAQRRQAQSRLIVPGPASVLPRNLRRRG